MGRDLPMNAITLPKPPRVGLVSLGCPKNLVDSERIMTKLRSEGYDMSPDYAGADVVLVNTCGFLDSAKEESLEAIGEAIAENGRVVVTGCMGKEAEVIRSRFPNVLAITGAHQYEEVVAAVHEAAPPIPSPFIDLVPEAGLKLTPRHYSYLKISEGCNHRCAFCIIPSLRGDLVSRRPDAVLVSNGAMGLGAVSVLQAHRAAGLRVPDDLAIAVFDDMPFFQLLRPTLTAIEQPTAEVGRLAMELLLAQIAGRPVEDARLACRLVLRQSTEGRSADVR